MDLDQVVALQGPLNTIAPASGRVLQCSKVKFVEKYIEVLDQQLEKQYYYQRLASLMRKGTRQSFTQSMHSEAENLDTTLGKAMLYAEKQCDPRFHHQNWSPQLIKRGLTVKFWKVLLSSRKLRKDCTAVLFPILRKYPNICIFEWLNTLSPTFKNDWQMLTGPTNKQMTTQLIYDRLSYARRRKPWYPLADSRKLQP
jgi:hypothetical protein